MPKTAYLHKIFLVTGAPFEDPCPPLLPQVEVLETPPTSWTVLVAPSMVGDLALWYSVVTRTKCSTLSPISTGTGDRLRPGIPPRYATKPTRSTQPGIPPGSLNQVQALIGWGRGGNVTSARWQVTLRDPIWYRLHEFPQLDIYYSVYFTSLYSVSDHRRDGK